MAWRFKASKYKNATPIVPKPEACIRDVTVGSYQTYGNNIAASAAFLAFNVDHNGSSLAVLPIDDCGRKSKTMPLLHAHTDTVTDMAFSPFHDGLLATGSQDCLVKLWHIPENGLQESLSDPECVFSHKQRRVETVSFHPSADCLLSTTSYTTLALWDVAAQKEIFSNSQHTEVIQSLSWKQDGTALVTSCKDKKLRIYDPRAPVESSIVQSTDSHQNIKDSRVVWLGNSSRILSTGFDATRLRQVYIRDIRNFSEPEKSLELDSSTGILLPLFDPDTNMLFLAGKGDITIAYMEVLDREPFLVEGIRHSGEQTKGACLVPKRALTVMQGEVNRVLQLTSTAVIPIMYQVPRKSYRDFHADLFPDTYGCHAKMSAAQWVNGENSPPPKLNLDPSKRGKEEAVQVHRGSLAQVAQELVSLSRTAEKNDINGSMNDRNGSDKIENGSESVTPPKPLPRSSRNGSLSESGDDQPNPAPNSNPAPSSSPAPVANSPPAPTPTPKPVARPRSTSSPSPGLAYKPRLGPKPFTPPKLNAFTSNSGEGTETNTSDFDKVFAVPNAPSGNQLSTSAAAPLSKCTNGNHANKSDEETPPSPPSPPSSPEKPRPASTLQRRPSDEADRVDSLERSGLRNSIAERRRLYESRSLSVQDPGGVTKAKTPSPTPHRRRLPQEEDSVKAPPQVQRAMSHDPTPAPVIAPSPAPTPKRTSTVFGRVSKFRHLKGSPGHKSTHIENIRNLSRQICGECDGFHGVYTGRSRAETGIGNQRDFRVFVLPIRWGAGPSEANRERVAVPLSGPGGRIAVLELSRTGRLPDGVTPALVHGTNIVDFQWDPFDCSRLAVACDDGTIKLWIIGPNGLTEPTNTPDASLSGHSEKIYLIKFHPLAKDILASASFDMTIRIWDLESCTERICLTGHGDQIFSMAWSPCGNFVATASKDTKIRMYEPRASTTPIREGRGPAGTRGARIVWALDGNYIVVLGFDKVSERQISVYRAVALNAAMSTVGLDVSPSILIPFYDEDSSTLFATGRGDSTIYAFEVSEEAPFLCPLSHHRASSLHQGLSFLPKNACDVANVEFAKALRLTNNTIEPLSFTVPRIKSDLFQDDIFPPTKVTWEPTMTGAEWFSGCKRLPRRINLRPPGMDSLSESLNPAPAPVPAQTNNRSGAVSVPAPTNRSVGRPAWAESPKQQQKQMHLAVSRRIEINTKLDQDEMEGVDDREWEE